MKIRRFNENQQYLTEPFDPDTELTFDISGADQWLRTVIVQFQLIEKELDVKFTQISDEFSFTSHSKKDPFVIELTFDIKSLYFMCNNEYVKTIGEVKEKMKEYFKV